MATEFNKRKSVNDKLIKYCVLAKDDSDFIEVTEWTNGEGWDIAINDKKIYSLTWGELEAINYLTNKIRYEFTDETD